MIYNLLHSTRLLADTCKAFTKKCVDGLEANEGVIASHLENSLMLVTALNNHSDMIMLQRLQTRSLKRFYLRESALELGLVTNDQFDQWVRPREMIGPKE